MVVTLVFNELFTFVIFVPNVPTEDCRLVTSDALAFVPRLVLNVETLLFNELLTVAIFAPSVFRMSVDWRRLLLLCYGWYWRSALSFGYPSNRI